MNIINFNPNNGDTFTIQIEDFESGGGVKSTGLTWSHEIKDSVFELVSRDRENPVQENPGAQNVLNFTFRHKLGKMLGIEDQIVFRSYLPGKSQIQEKRVYTVKVDSST